MHVAPSLSLFSAHLILHLHIQTSVKHRPRTSCTCTCTVERGSANIGWYNSTLGRLLDGISISRIFDYRGWAWNALTAIIEGLLYMHSSSRGKRCIRNMKASKALSRFRPFNLLLLSCIHSVYLAVNAEKKKLEIIQENMD